MISSLLAVFRGKERLARGEITADTYNRAEELVHNPDAQSVLQKFNLPKRKDTIEDKIASAQGGSGPFLYVTVVGDSLESRRSVMQRLAASRMRGKVSQVPTPEDTTPILLTAWRHDFPLSAYFSKALFEKTSTFVQLEEVKIVFTPTVGLYDRYSSLRIGLSDERFTEEDERRVVIGQTNISMMCMLSLDYFVHKNSLKHLKLFVQASNSGLIQGEIWGTLRVFIKLFHSANAEVCAIKPTAGLLVLPQATMQKVRTNINALDLTLDEDDFHSLQDMNKKGRIVNQDRPLNDQRIAAVAGSEAGDSDDDGHPDPHSYQPTPSRGLSTWVSSQNPPGPSTPPPIDNNFSDYEENLPDKVEDIEEVENLEQLIAKGVNKKVHFASNLSSLT